MSTSLSTPLSTPLSTNDFDTAVVTAVLEQAGLVGWRDTSLVDAARDAGLDLPRLRLRFPGKTAVLLRFGTLADQAALAAAPSVGPPRDRLFDIVMARFDQLQAHRPGILAVMDSLRTDPATALLLYGATLRSMRWMLDAAGIPTTGLTGQLRIHGLLVAWTYALRAWKDDDGTDLPATMAALDRALDRAVQAEASLPGHRPLPDQPFPGSATDPDPAMDLDPAIDPDPAMDPDLPFTDLPRTETTTPPQSLKGSDVADGPDGPAVL